MSSFSSYSRRGAKTRRTPNQPAGRMPSPESHQDHHHKSSYDHKTPNKGSKSPTSMVRPDRTWAEVARTSPGRNTELAVKIPSYHSVAKDPAVPYPFAANPHFLITGIYSGSSDNQNEQVFRHVYPVGQATTRELLHRYRTEMHASIQKKAPR